ncbi:hypothetical protein [Pseudoalteromonas shioyasakiensis]|uniref:hypothetical protein n=1 Tax=Pseudoalteromonas shioyasakiensis TaxID=1190813 RepID=UPI002551CFBD|nr:hypothetical protein [Pseudoalteromonas shioyasakiensis]MDK9683213.1 hypothetical protein [Pseudoalteromonas shioyasakiensis]
MGTNCSICCRKLDQENDPLSDDCGGDCWGCIGEIEADMGCEYAIKKLGEEFKAGLRNCWLPSPIVKFNNNSDAVEVYLKNPLGEPYANESFELQLYSKLMFNRTKVHFNKLVTTNLNGVVAIPIDKKSKLKNSWCKVARGDKIWTCRIEIR